VRKSQRIQIIFSNPNALKKAKFQEFGSEKAKLETLAEGAGTASLAEQYLYNSYSYMIYFSTLILKKVMNKLKYTYKYLKWNIKKEYKMGLVYDSQFLTILEDLRSTLLLRRDSFTFFLRHRTMCAFGLSVITSFLKARTNFLNNNLYQRN